MSGRMQHLWLALSLNLLRHVHIVHSADLPSEPLDLAKCTNEHAVASIPYVPSWDGHAAKKFFNAPHLGLPMLCGGSEPIAQHMIVAAGPPKRKSSWMTSMLKVSYILYEADNLRSPHHHYNVGNEAMTYLRFIADYYDCLPEVILFAHSHQQGTWHREGSLDSLVEKLKWDAVTGFSYLQLNLEAFKSVYIQNVTQNLDGRAILPPYQGTADSLDCNVVINGTLYPLDAAQEYINSQLIGRWWDIFFGPMGMGPVPDRLEFRVGAEFLVRKSRVLAWPRSFYLKALSFMYELNESGTMPSFEIGVVFERVWHVLFGNSPTSTSMLSRCDLYECMD